MEYYRTSHMSDTPSLEFMTETALKVLSKNEKGFFLMVCIAAKIKIFVHYQVVHLKNYFTSVKPLPHLSNITKFVFHQQWKI